MRFGILVFPGSWSHDDFRYVLREVMGLPAELVWHKEETLAGYDCLILPGGFAHGDYLRCGAIARFSPVMAAVAGFARARGLVIGSCNGFQILTEAGLLPGALLRNSSLEYRCQWVSMRVESRATPFVEPFHVGEVIRMPISHGEGRYYADAETLRRLNASGQVVLRYCDAAGQITPEANPNGALENIAGICNEAGNVFGLMPHPERAAEPILGGTDGRRLLEAVLAHAAAR